MSKIKEFYFENRSKIIIAVSVLMLLTAVLELYFVLAVQVTSNDECSWVPKKAANGKIELIFQLVKVNGVTWNAGIRNGDKFLAINNKYFDNDFRAQGILDSIPAGKYADYTIVKDGKTLHTKVYIKKLIYMGYLAMALLAVMFMLIGFIVLMAKPNGKVQKLFFGIGVSSVMQCVFVFFHPVVFVQTTGSLIGALLLSITFSLGYGFFPFLFLAFFCTFPKPFAFMEKVWVKRMFIILPVIFSVMNLAGLIFLTAFNKFKLENFTTYRTWLGYFNSSIEIMALIALIISYRRLKTREEKKPVLIILIAFIIAIAAVFYTAKIAHLISDSLWNSPEYYAPIILIVIVPIAFAYSIFKYQLLDVSVVVKNTILYGTATISIAAIYFFIIYILGQGISKAIGTEFQGIIAGVIFIIFAVVFQSTKDKYQDFLTEKFYPEQFAYQRVLLKFGNEVATLVGLDNILDSMKETFVESLMINRFGVMIKNKKEEKFQLVRNVGISDGDLFALDENLRTAINQKQQKANRIIIEQNEFSTVFPEISQRLISEGIYTVIPMIVKSNVVGLLLFGLKHSGSQFAGKDLDLLSLAASQCAISIENARLYESEAEKLKIERDLALARRIQQGLLPKCIPNMNGLDICGEMIPAMQVGGDYYDLLPVSDTKLFVVVGDVSGKGLPASLYMTKLQTMIQLACSDTKTPREIMVELNRRFYDSLERNSFITMTLALFDTAKNRVSFCRAGHMPVLTSTNGTIHSYRTQGIGVGLEKGKIFEKTLIQEEVELKPGQTFAFFSDGITEAMDENSDLFGEENLSELLKNSFSKTSTEIMNEIWTSLSKFRGNAEQNDDMTMVIVKVS